MNYFIDFITGISPSVAVVLAASLSPWISNKNEKRRSKHEALKERYDKLYLPFIYEIIKFNVDYTELVLSSGIRQQFLDILLPNIKYMDKESFAFISDLYTTHIDLISYEKLSYEDKQTLSNVNQKNIEVYSQMFTITSKSILREASEISKELSMPDIASTVEFR